MNQNNDLSKAWVHWMDVVLREIVSLVQAGDYDRALIKIDGFLSHEKVPEFRSEALGFKAQIKEQLGDVDSAKEALLVARSPVGPCYTRYVHELSLADISRRQQRPDEAISWYRAALQTCIEGQGISGGTALKGFLSVLGEKRLTPREHSLCAQVAKRSWQVLGLPSAYLN